MRVGRQLQTAKKPSGKSRQSESLNKRVNLLFLLWGSGEGGVGVYGMSSWREASQLDIGGHH